MHIIRIVNTNSRSINFLTKSETKIDRQNEREREKDYKYDIHLDNWICATFFFHSPYCCREAHQTRTNIECVQTQTHQYRRCYVAHFKRNTYLLCAVKCLSLIMEASTSKCQRLSCSYSTKVV